MGTLAHQAAKLHNMPTAAEIDTWMESHHVTLFNTTLVAYFTRPELNCLSFSNQLPIYNPSSFPQATERRRPIASKQGCLLHVCPSGRK